MKWSVEGKRNTSIAKGRRGCHAKITLSKPGIILLEYWLCTIMALWREKNQQANQKEDDLKVEYLSAKVGIIPCRTCPFLIWNNNYPWRCHALIIGRYLSLGLFPVRATAFVRDSASASASATASPKATAKTLPQSLWTVSNILLNNSLLWVHTLLFLIGVVDTMVDCLRCCEVMLSFAAERCLLLIEDYDVARMAYPEKPAY